MNRLCTICGSDVDHPWRGSKCRACRNVRAAELRTANPGKHNAYNRKWYAENKDRVKIRTKAYIDSGKNAEARRRFRAANIERCREQDRIRYAARSEEIRLRKNENYRKMYRENPYAIKEKNRRRRAAGVAPISKDEWLTLLEEFDFRCAYCRCGDCKLTVDHFTPITRGGEHSLLNIVPACKSCNSSKRNQLIFLWLPKFLKEGRLGRYEQTQIG